MLENMIPSCFWFFIFFFFFYKMLRMTLEIISQFCLAITRPDRKSEIPISCSWMTPINEFWRNVISVNKRGEERKHEFISIIQIYHIVMLIFFFALKKRSKINLKVKFPEDHYYDQVPVLLYLPPNYTAVSPISATTQPSVMKHFCE